MSNAESSRQGRAAGQPILVLNEDIERTQGHDAQQANISAGKAIAESVRTTLGPRGMDKMLVSDAGDVVITNDGATILDEIDIEHPAAEMLVDVADSQEEAVGDGTTTAAILAGELLAEAEEFLERNVHPRTIVEGYFEAERLAIQAIEDQVLTDEIDDDRLTKVAQSALTGKGTGDISTETLASTIVDAVQHIAAETDVPRELIRVQAQIGRSATATELVEGIVIDAEPVRSDMPHQVQDSTVAVLDTALEQRETEIDAEYDIQSTEQLTAAIETEEATLKEYADVLTDAGVDVVFVTDDIADQTADYLASAGILAFDNIDSDDADALTKVTGANQLAHLDDIEENDLGEIGSISIEQFDEDDVVFIEGGTAAETVTVFVRGGTDHALAELERAVNDGIDVVVAALNSGEVVPGAGATEIAIASALRDEAAGIEGRKQLAVGAFADALDAIPRTLAQNAGVDPIDALVDLRAANDDGRAGLTVGNDETTIDDPVEHGILDPATVKREAIHSASEVATMIVRIDDVISTE